MSQFQTIKRTLQDQIESGLLTAGCKLPAERKLAELFDTTRITLREALVLLESEGVIYREERRGWFVSPPRLDYNPAERSHFHEMVRQQGRQPDTRLLDCQTLAANTEISRLLQLPALSRVHRVQRLRRIDQRPVLYVEHYLNPAPFPDILQHNLNGSLTEIYQQHYGVGYGRLRLQIYPTALTGEAAAALNVAQGSHGLLIIRVNYDQENRILDCDYEYWRHDAVCLLVDTAEF
ncbi:phosphonate utilization transcriptional regulator PhnR [Marinobacterium jannaschii]|uniref:phosphonate utilization transcriptional regulator PhnR n=1 Tax=Marinobacterium jannaschii TaxID=64970 RepID=UPI000481C61B|nr:phosphonate utilization transcriptional regulator PhnR [Marinobacterium jannaschii]